MGGGSTNTPYKMSDGKPLAHLVLKSNIVSRPLTDLSAMGRFLHIKPTTGCQMSTSIKQIWVRGGSLNIPCKILEDKVLVHFGFKSKVLPRPLADLSACVGFCTSSPQQGVKFQLRYRGVGLINISCKLQTAKFLSTLGLSQRYYPGV